MKVVNFATILAFVNMACAVFNLIQMRRYFDVRKRYEDARESYEDARKSYEDARKRYLESAAKMEDALKKL